LSPTRWFFENDDFTSASAGGLGWSSVIASGGAAGTVGSAETNHPGIYTISCDASTAGSRAAYRLANGIFNFGGGPYSFSYLIKTPAGLSSAIDAYILRIGLNDNAGASGEAVDGAYFQYTHSTNGGLWTCVTLNNSVGATNAAGSAVNAGQWYWLRCDIAASSASATFYVDGVAIATNTTYVPSGTGARGTTQQFQIERTGTAATLRELRIDYFEHEMTLER
jgi:hypothetical protein